MFQKLRLQFCWTESCESTKKLLRVVDANASERLLDPIVNRPLMEYNMMVERTEAHTTYRQQQRQQQQQNSWLSLVHEMLYMWHPMSSF